MAKLLFRLNGVEEEEANAVRELLSNANIEFYETDAGRWRISLAAMWLQQESDFDEARRLIDLYQQERAELMRLQPPVSFWQRSKDRPAELIFTVMAIVLVLGLILWPFFNLG